MEQEQSVCPERLFLVATECNWRGMKGVQWCFDVGARFSRTKSIVTSFPRFCVIEVCCVFPIAHVRQRCACFLCFAMVKRRVLTHQVSKRGFLFFARQVWSVRVVAVVVVVVMVAASLSSAAVLSLSEI